MDKQIEFYEKKLAYEMDSWDLNQALEQGEAVAVIDARNIEAHEIEHIPNDINLPHSQMNEESTRHFNRDILYVVYCDGIGCNASTKGALKLTRLGFRVKELMGGLDWWKRDGYTTEGSAEKGCTSKNCGCC